MNHRILLVDDEPDILEFVGYNLQRAGYLVQTAEDGLEALRIAQTWRPHLILLDRMMPRMDGLETCRQLRQIESLKSSRIVFLTALDEEHHHVEGFEVGADDYIAKPIRMQALLSRVSAILRRVEADPGGRVRLDMEQRAAFLDGVPLVLPRKEFYLLALLYSQPGKLFSREEIYRTVWGNEVVVGDRTIDVHVRKLRQKIGDHHIQTVKGLGYKFEP